MKLLVAFMALVAASFVAGEVPFVINTPTNVLQCLPVEITWQGGNGPFSLRTPDVNGNTLQTFDNITSSPFIWEADTRADEPLQLSLTDLSDGNKAVSGIFTVEVSGQRRAVCSTELTFQGGPGPFSLVISTPDANGHTLQTFDGITSSPFTWATNIRAGTQVGVSLTDVSTGSVALSGSFTVEDSGDSSCLA
ncbi:hypothetical protein BC629DRAFT_1597789 [Irpex lacteus]|nr:hypothetical protein BC629DRAFT_1597789 [Irpex lacteus]